MTTDSRIARLEASIGIRRRSIHRCWLCKSFFWCLVTAYTLSFIASPVTAQKTTFTPALTLYAFATDNVAYIGDEEELSDSGLRLSLILPVVRDLKSGSISFTYHAAVERYTDFGSLDNISHLVSLEAETLPSRDSRFNIRATYFKSQDQGDPRSIDPADLFLDRRTDRERVSLDLTFNDQLGRRWTWGFDLGGSLWKFKDISDFEEIPPSERLEDRTELRGSVGLARILSRSDSLGVRYDYRRFDLEVSGEEISHWLSLVYGRELIDRLSLELRVGGFLSTGEAAAGSEGSPDDERSGVQGSLRLTRSFRRSDLTFLAGHAPSSGGAREGTSTDSYVGLSYGSRATRRWNWGLNIRYARRDPSDPAQGIIDSFSAGFEIGRLLGRQAGFQLGGNYVGQIGAEPGADSSFFRGWLGLVWYPLARTRVAGR